MEMKEVGLVDSAETEHGCTTLPATIEKSGVADMARRPRRKASISCEELIAWIRAKKRWRIAMKKFLLGTVGLCALGMAAPASAADLPARPYTKAPPPMVIPVYDWSGFYIGANAGYGWSNRCLDVTAINGVGVAEAEGCRNAGGGVAGGQIGYRWQSANWVFGIEAQGDWANLRNQTPAWLSPEIPGAPKPMRWAFSRARLVMPGTTFSGT